MTPNQGEEFRITLNRTNIKR